MAPSEELDHLRARRDRLVHEIEMMTNDIAAWNQFHPTEEPIDAEELLAEPRAILADIDRKIGLSDEGDNGVG